MIVNKRRVFLKKNDKDYQIFSFTQENDGSIYVNWPEFSSTIWLNQDFKNNRLITQLGEKEGKLSIHASGRAHYKAYGEKDSQMIVKGNTLLNAQLNSGGVRHLFSAFIKEPSYSPEKSPVFNRKSDYLILSKTEIKPQFLLVFAIPMMNPPMSIRINSSFDIDELDNFELPSFLTFPLKYHDIAILTYRTKNLDQWPAEWHIAYSDGYECPFFIGLENQQIMLEFLKPIYDVRANKLNIILNRKGDQSFDWAKFN